MKYIFNREPFPFLIRFQSYSEGTPVFSGKYWSTFREGLESFPQDWDRLRTPVPVFSQEWPGTCGNKPKNKFVLYIAD